MTYSYGSLSPCLGIADAPTERGGYSANIFLTPVMYFSNFCLDRNN